MKQYILLLFIMIPLLSYGKTDEEKLLERVDHAIEMDSHYKQQKEKELKRLRRLAGDAITDEERLCYLDSLYRAYSNYRYDSSCAYVSKGLQLAEATHNTFYITCFKIHRASALSVGGFYAKAENILKTLDPKQMPYKQKLYYYFTYAWLFNYWESYAAKSEFANDFKAKKKYYMSSDANGCMSVTLPDGSQKQLAVAPDSFHDEVQAAILLGVPLEILTRVVSTNPAQANGLYPQKGCLRVDSDADFIIYDDDYAIATVVAKGKVMVQDGQVLVKGTFER